MGCARKSSIYRSRLGKGKPESALANSALRIDLSPSEKDESEVTLRRPGWKEGVAEEGERQTEREIVGRRSC